MVQRFFFLFFSILTSFCFSKPPELTPRDARIKIEEILKAHVTYQELTSDIIRRSFQNFLEELDPQKSYLLRSDVAKWLDAGDELVNEALSGFKRENFTHFIDMHEVMLRAIQRRASLDKEIDLLPLPTDVKVSEFKDLEWVASEEELSQRLIRIKALQYETAEKFEPDVKNLFFQRVQKRRLNREEELTATSDRERLQTTLAMILKATSSALDSQTNYFTPSEANQFMIQVQQRLFGIGAQLRDDINGFTIVRILEGSPAGLNNQLKIGDRVIAVNHEPVVGMDITEAVELIRGERGTSVILTVVREMGEGKDKQEEMHYITVMRDEIVLKETRLETTHEPYGDGVIGILHLFSFYQDATTSSANDLRLAIDALKEEHHLKGIILDLRNNGGGFLPQAVAVTGLFIKKGVVVSVKDNTGHVQHLRNIEEKIAWDGPLIVLTNKVSASAAEIVAQTLKDYGRAIIVGDKETYGKGTFQTFTLEAVGYGKVDPKGEYKVTRGRYYTVSGTSPQLTGVEADVIVPGLYSKMEIGEKFAKFPLEPDMIAPNFEDHLDDIPAIHHPQIIKLYKFDLQPILSIYTNVLDTLKINSSERMTANKNYQNFLKELDKKEFVSEDLEAFGESDLQLTETVNIIKDMVFLMNENSLTAKAS
ncbi:MAG: S41 family peptidase [Chlamydiota bacterium]